MFWIVIVYVLFASVIAFWIGRPIIWLSFRNEKSNAAFRYALVRLRDASEAVAFYRGEMAERTGLRKLFAPIVANYKRYVQPAAGLLRLEPVDEPDHRRPLPYLFQFPRFFSGEITARRHDPVGVGIRQDPERAVVLPERLRLVRQLSRGDHPARRPDHRQRRRQGAAGDHDDAVRRRHGAAHRYRGPHPRRQAAGQPARPAPGSRRHDGGHRCIGRRQDHTAAQPCRAVAVHVRHADAARAGRTRRCSSRRCPMCRSATCAPS